MEDQMEQEEIADEEKDLMWALTKPLEEMSLEEQLEALKRIRELRKVRIASGKRKDPLDHFISQLTPDKAAAMLKKLDAMEADQEQNEKQS